MAIFSRRTLQHLINENAKFLKKEQSLKFIKELNRSDESLLGFEWEVVLINALSKFGKVEYEQDLGGKSRPDIKFESTYSDTLSFVADIATVSDRGYEDNNPLKDFYDEFKRLVKKNGLRLNYFSIKIGRIKQGSFKNRKIKLKIPPRGKFNRVFNAKFHNYLRMIAIKPKIVKDFVLQTDSIEVYVKYNPTQEFFVKNHASYKTPYSLTKNPLYNNLKRKTKQLKETDYSGAKAIFLCDGNSESLKSDGYAGFSYNTSQIIHNFLMQNSSISFVLLFTIQREINIRGMGPPIIEIQFLKNTIAKQKIDLEFLVRELPKILPKPVNDALNAINQLNKIEKRKFSPFYGGLYMTEDSIKISARVLLELLAGKIEQSKFFEDYKPFKSFFDNKIREGRLITNISLEKVEEDDDDWLVIKFGKHDPAISKFTLHEESK